MKSWDERAEDCIAQGTNTYSRRSDQFVKGVFPTHITKAEGCTLYDEKGKGYIDFIGGLGSNIISSNNNFSLPTVYEVELAEKIKEKIKFIDKLRFLKTGSEACLAAVRIARAYTSHHMVLGLGYHGWGNIFISEENPGAGCEPELYRKFDTIDEIIDAIDNNHSMHEIGAVIIEPVQLDINVREDLIKLRNKCSEKGIVLIFDEVITGFRTPKYCIAQYLDVRPDIICLGKAMANGYPLSVVGGQAKFMDAKGWFVSSTFASELSAIKEASTTIDFLTEERLEELWKAGAWFQKEFNKLTKKLQLVGIPTKAVFRGEELFKNIFWQEMCKKGYLMGKAWHIMFAHLSGIEGCTPLDKALETCTEVIKRIETQPIGLEGKMAQEVFKRY